VPVNLAATVMHSLIESGSVSRGYLGVASQTLSPDHAEALGLERSTKGVMITDVFPDTPAEKAGLERGDVILSFNDKVVTSLRDLRVLIAQTAPGSKVKLNISRDGKDRVIEAALSKLDDKPDELLPGVEVTPLTQETRRRLNIPDRFDGLLVTKVDEESKYADRFAPDVLILQIDREDVIDLNTARKALTPGRHMLFVYYRGTLRVVGVEVE
jgi:serine protease Do/serine protease DegQ